MPQVIESTLNHLISQVSLSYFNDLILTVDIAFMYTSSSMFSWVSYLSCPSNTYVPFVSISLISDIEFPVILLIQ